MLRLLTLVTDVSIFSVNIVTMLGLGLAIDYALFVVSRFREELAKRPGTGRADVAVAIERTMGSAGRTVLFSGVTVAVALASLLFFPQTFLRSMGFGGMAAVLVAMVGALTVLPALLAVLGHRVDSLRVPAPWTSIRTQAWPCLVSRTPASLGRAALVRPAAVRDRVEQRLLMLPAGRRRTVVPCTPPPPLRTEAADPDRSAACSGTCGRPGPSGRVRASRHFGTTRCAGPAGTRDDRRDRGHRHGRTRARPAPGRPW